MTISKTEKYRLQGPHPSSLFLSESTQKEQFVHKLHAFKLSPPSQI